MSEDATGVVLESAYATHLACVMTWQHAYCVYPWHLDVRKTWITSFRLTKRQRRDLSCWIANVGNGVVLKNLNQCDGQALSVCRAKWWRISFHVCREKKIRYVSFLLVELF
jgi:hypothetical protein